MHYTIIIFLALICFFFQSSTTHADQRSDATALLTQFRQEGVATRLPDEMRSLDATLATAEMYYQLYDQKNAERYYQLAIQKGALIKQRLLASVPSPPQLPTIVTSTANQNTADAPQAMTPMQAAVQKPISSPSAQPTAPQSPDVSLEPEEQEPFGSDRLVGTAGAYTVLKGDTIRMVAAKLGLSRTQLAAMNGLKPQAPLRVGQVLRYNNQRIIPVHRLRDGIVINIPDRMLYLFQQGSMTFSTAVALGTPTKTKQFVWETPIGKFRIVNKAKDPTWTVPPSIQEEMRLEGKEIITASLQVHPILLVSTP